MNVYKAINAVQADLAQIGITKDRKNVQQGYNFRGIDDVYNALSPLLAKHSLCILPRILSRNCVERETQKGSTIFYITVEAEFDFVCAEDGSKHVVRTYGEAMDSADKATNKAMSAAYKYAAFQAFAIPTVGDNDADAHTPPPVKAEKPAAPPVAPKVSAKAEGKPGRWQITIQTDPGAEPTDYINAVAKAVVVCLEQATSQAEVMDIYKVNRSLFDKVKELDEGSHKDLMEAFKTKKDSFQ